MAILELSTPALAQNVTTQEAFTNTLLPTLKTLLEKATKNQLRTIGKMLTFQGQDVSSEFRPVFAVEWPSVEVFQAVLTGPEFAAFAPSLMAHITDFSASGPQLYNTNVAPKLVLESPVTELFKVKVGDDEKKGAVVRKAWAKFVGELEEVESLNGMSVNLEDKVFLGVVGWKSEELREMALKGDGVQEMKGKFGDFSSSVVKFSEL